MSEAATKTIVGTCTEISEKGDWTTFHIDSGSQYPTRLSTKQQPIIELGRAANKAGGQYTWTFNESQGKENPNRPGTFYVNRYLEGVEPASAAAVATASEGQMTPEKWDAKERRDYRSRAWAQTLGAFQHTIKADESPEEVFLRLQPFQRKVFIDVCGLFAFPEGDEDIPF